MLRVSNDRAVTRRDVLVRAAHGFGAVALASLIDPPGMAAVRANPLAAKAPHFAAKAKSVIHVYLQGGDVPQAEGRNPGRRIHAAPHVITSHVVQPAVRAARYRCVFNRARLPSG